VFDEMRNREQWSVKDHPRTCIPHDHPDPFTHIRPVTMDRTILAGWFFFPERAMIQSLQGIIKGFPAM
jgi:hypothetical protein